MKRWKKEQTLEIYRNHMFSLNRTRCRHPAKGMIHNFFSLETVDWINVVATTEEGRFILVRQHRLGIDEITLEIPGGMVDPGDTPEQSAARELAEETGYRAGSMTLLKTLSANPAILTNRLHIFHAADCVCSGDQRLDAAEDIEVALASREEILEMLRNGDIHHSLVVAALGLYFLAETGVL